MSASGSSGYGVAPARIAENAAVQPGSFGTSSAPSRQTGYGLPCARCKTYYAADLAACPVCKSPQRVSPIEPLAQVAPAENLPDAQQLEAERDRFLSEFNAQMNASPLPPDLPVPAMHCSHIENHASAPEPATICQGCYDRLQERVDVLEAALHMDITEAAQVIYDAVWADPSDPSKTYLNAAQSLLTELRRRSGVPQVFGPLQSPVN
jgi:RNA polymerase subunit RPABC4/transcription elongation factor Spt4